MLLGIGSSWGIFPFGWGSLRVGAALPQSKTGDGCMLGGISFISGLIALLIVASKSGIVKPN